MIDAIKKLFAVSCFCVVLHYPNLFGNDGMYVGGQLGLNLVKDSSLSLRDFSVDLEFDPGFAFNGVWGMDIGDARVEGEVGYQENDLDSAAGVTRSSGDTDVVYALINGFYDFEISDTFTPYAGIGFGVARVNLSSNSEDFDEHDVVPVGQITVGFSYAINKTWEVDLGYKLFITEDPEYFDDGDGEYLSNKFSIGLRFYYE